MNDIFNNREFIFLERDYQCPSSDDSIRSGKVFMSLYLGIDENIINNMPIEYQYHFKPKKELTDLLFDKNKILVTHSVYVQGSNSDFFHFAAMAGRNGIKDLIYIDTSGCLINFLNRELFDEKNAIDIIAGINSNTIITRENTKDSSKASLLKIEINGKFDNCVKLLNF